MTDKPAKIEQWAGCGLSDPKPRKAQSVYNGLDFVSSPTNGTLPAKDSDGHKIGSIKHVGK